MKFSQRVWELATLIPAGRVTTYGALARAAGGGAQSARSIGNILSKAPNQGAIPWHRIVYSDGRVWFSSEHETKRRALYEHEDIHLDHKDRIIDFEEKLIDLSEL